jgi:hypothetical protein
MIDWAMCAAVISNCCMPCVHAGAVGLRAEPLHGGRERDTEQAGAAIQAGGSDNGVSSSAKERNGCMLSVHTCTAVGYWAAVSDDVVVKETLSELELPYKQVGHVCSSGQGLLHAVCVHLCCGI